MKDFLVCITLIVICTVAIAIPIVIESGMDLEPVVDQRCVKGMIEVRVEQPDESSQWWPTKAPCREVTR